MIDTLICPRFVREVDCSMAVVETLISRCGSCSSKTVILDEC